MGNRFLPCNWNRFQVRAAPSQSTNHLHDTVQGEGRLGTSCQKCQLMKNSYQRAKQPKCRAPFLATSAAINLDFRICIRRRRRSVTLRPTYPPGRPPFPVQSASLPAQCISSSDSKFGVLEIWVWDSRPSSG